MMYKKRIIEEMHINQMNQHKKKSDRSSSEIKALRATQ